MMERVERKGDTLSETELRYAFKQGIERLLGALRSGFWYYRIKHKRRKKGWRQHLD